MKAIQLQLLNTLVLCGISIITMNARAQITDNKALQVVKPSSYYFQLSLDESDLTDCSEISNKVNDYINDGCLDRKIPSNQCVNDASNINVESQLSLVQGVNLGFSKKYTVETNEKIQNAPTEETYRMDIFYTYDATLDPNDIQIQPEELASKSYFSVANDLGISSQLSIQKDDFGLRLIAGNKLIACALENKEIKILAHGLVHLGTYQPKEKNWFDLIVSLYPSAQKIQLSSNSVGKKQFLLGLAVGELLRDKMPKASVDQIQQLSGSFFNLLIEDEDNSFNLRTNQTNPNLAANSLLNPQVDDPNANFELVFSGE